MARAYRAPNGRIIHRAGGGRFRRSTLADIGMGCCEVCGAIYGVDLSDLDGPFIDPAEVNRRRRLCPEHRRSAAE